MPDTPGFDTIKDRDEMCYLNLDQISTGGDIWRTRTQLHTRNQPGLSESQI